MELRKPGNGDDVLGGWTFLRKQRYHRVRMMKRMVRRMIIPDENEPKWKFMRALLVSPCSEDSDWSTDPLSLAVAFDCLVPMVHLKW